MELLKKTSAKSHMYERSHYISNDWVCVALAYQCAISAAHTLYMPLKPLLYSVRQQHMCRMIWISVLYIWRGVWQLQLRATFEPDLAKIILNSDSTSSSNNKTKSPQQQNNNNNSNQFEYSRGSNCGTKDFSKML